jgi:hypothetical protein
LVDPVCEVVHFEGGGSGRFAGLFSASRESDAIGLVRHPGSVRTGNSWWIELDLREGDMVR